LIDSVVIPSVDTVWLISSSSLAFAEKAKVEDKYNTLKQAIANLTPDVSPLERAKADLENDINQVIVATLG
jgi:hypothetical protein